MVSSPVFGQEITQINLRLQEIRNRDQSIRLNISKSQQKGDIDSLIFYVEQMSKIDAENQKYVDEIIPTKRIPDGYQESPILLYFWWLITPISVI